MMATEQNQQKQALIKTVVHKSRRYDCQATHMYIVEIDKQQQPQSLFVLTLAQK